MNAFKVLGYRLFQTGMYLASFFLNFREPKLYSGEDSINKLPDILKERELHHPLIVTDNSLYELGLLNGMINTLSNASIEFSIYHEVVPNPTVENVNEGLLLYKMQNCDCLIAFGGGSSLDCAKAIGALVNNVGKTVDDLGGVLKVKLPMPFFIAIPTTAGTGSETTLAAVIVNPERHNKYAINDPHLIPDAAIHDPKLLVNLPSKVTSTTGMDALTHAVEAFIGRSNTVKTSKAALSAIKLIDENLIHSYKKPENLEYRQNMLKGSYLAGVAFTRAYVGYVHAIAHSLGGRYNVPHGLANAIILPYVLEAFGKSIHSKLARISDYLSLIDKTARKDEKAAAFIAYIKDLNKQMDIPDKFHIEYDENEVYKLIKHAMNEANPLYPVPKEFDYKDFQNIYKKILK